MPPFKLGIIGITWPGSLSVQINSTGNQVNSGVGLIESQL